MPDFTEPFTLDGLDPEATAILVDLTIKAQLVAHLVQRRRDIDAVDRAVDDLLSECANYQRRR